MPTSPEAEELLADLYERAAVVDSLDGPQIEGWASGLFAVFGDVVSAEDFVDYCAAQGTTTGHVVCAAIGELADGVDPRLAERARAGAARTELTGVSEQFGQSILTGAWSVDAPFGSSIILGFDGPAIPPQAGAEAPPSAEAPDGDMVDNRHAILVEHRDGRVEDLQLAGPAQLLLDEVVASDGRVQVSELDVAEALDRIIAMWPGKRVSHELGPGFEVNQHFVRRRVYLGSGTALEKVTVESDEVDIRRGLSADEYADANRAALSTLQAALGTVQPDQQQVERPEGQAWMAVIRGDAAGVSPRERDALMWLEWADWLGVGIGLHRAGAGAEMNGGAFVDLVNRCPEVSSTIDKADRDYAEWAFEVALDLLADSEVGQAGKLTEAGLAALGPAMVAAWTNEESSRA